MVLTMYVPKRYIFAFLAHLGFFVVYALRVNLSVALVAMVNNTQSIVNNTTTLGSSSECPARNVSVLKHNKGGEFNWDQNQQGIILSSFFYGYLFTQLPGGLLGNKYGGKWVFALGVLSTCVLTLLTPIAVNTSPSINFYLFIAIRVLEGVGEGVTYPVMHTMLGKWSPPAERTTLSVLAYSGSYAGTVISLPLSSILCNSTFLGGWPSAFYVSGFAGVVWFFFWILFVSNSPESHPTISEEEKALFLDADQQSCSTGRVEKKAIPWIPILTSVHVWAITMATFCGAWVWYLILTDLPSYFMHVLNFDLMEDGFLSGLPFLASFIVSLASGYLADHLIKRWNNVKQVRRMLSLIATYTSCVCLILVSFTGCEHPNMSVSLMVLACGVGSLNASGYAVNHLDLSPRFAGILMAISNFFGTVAGSLTPLVTGYFTNNEPTRKQYRKVFLIASAVSFFGATFFAIFVSGKEQVWNDPNNNVTVHTGEEYDGEEENEGRSSDTDLLITS